MVFIENIFVLVKTQKLREFSYFTLKILDRSIIKEVKITFVIVESYGTNRPIEIMCLDGVFAKVSDYADNKGVDIG